MSSELKTMKTCSGKWGRSNTTLEADLREKLRRCLNFTLYGGLLNWDMKCAFLRTFTMG